MESLVNKKFQLTAGAFILTAAFILWEYFNGGVISHHLLARKDLPGLSNWWGLMTIPFLTWLSLTIITKRESRRDKLNPNGKSFTKVILQRFFVALLFGLVASVLWTFGFSDFLKYYILSPLVIAIFRPLYFSEYLLGFVIGMLFTFGGILPIIVGIVLLILCFLVNTLIRILKNLFISKPERKK